MKRAVLDANTIISGLLMLCLVSWQPCSCHQFPIERSILYRLGHVGLFDVLGSGEVCDRSGDLENT